MAAVKHRRPDDHGEEKASIRALLDQQLDRQKCKRQPDRDGNDREMEPRDHKRAEGERDRADRRRQFVIAAPAEEIHPRQRDQQLHRGLGGHGVAERQRQREDAQRRHRGALAIGEQWIAAAGQRVPDREVQRAPRLPRLMRPRHDLHGQIVHLRVRQQSPLIPVSPRRQDVDEVHRHVDVAPGHRPEEVDQNERVEERGHAPRQRVTDRRNPPPGACDRDRVERAGVDPCGVEHGRGS